MDDILDIDKPYNTRVNNETLKATAKKEEPRFLSILLKDKDCLMDAVSFGIQSGDTGHFWIDKPRFLYSIIFEYYQKYGEILTRTAMESVMDSLSGAGGARIDDDDRTTARMYYDEVYSIDAPVEDYELLRDNLNNRYVQWQAYSIMREEMEQIVKATSGQAEHIKKIREKFLHIDNLDAESYIATVNMVEAMPTIRENIVARRERPEEDPNIPTYIEAIDRMYHLPPGSYTVVAGMINGGKSTFMFNVGFNMAKAGHSVVYVSIEKEAIPILTRLTSLHAMVDYNRIKTGGKGDYGLNDMHFDRLIEATRDLETNIKPNFECIQCVQETKLSKIISEVDKIKARKKIDVLIVDYLGVIGFETHHPGRPDLDEALVSKRLQAYGRVNRFVTIAGSQLKTPSSKEIRNRAKNATADDPSSIQVNTEDLAGSKMIIADADNGISVVLNHDSPPTKMFVYGTKARDDEAHNCVVLDFDGRLGRVSDPEFDNGHITEVDALVYDDQVTEEDLASDDGLFDSEDEASEAIEELNDDDFDFVDDEQDKNKTPIKTLKEETPKDLLDDDIFQL
jgi:replicative DNA helicase